MPAGASLAFAASKPPPSIFFSAKRPTLPHARLAQAMLDKGGDLLSKLERYAAAAERSYYKAHKELMLSVQARTQQQAALKSMRGDALLEQFLRPPVYKTKPNPVDIDDDELELLTRPGPYFPATRIVNESGTIAPRR